VNQEKYIGYLESQIANTMWPSGLCRGEEALDMRFDWKEILLDEAGGFLVLV
jgi:hypothetical protein